MAATVASPALTRAAETCAQWDVGGTTWGPLDQHGAYTPTVIFAQGSSATQVSGSMSLPEGQWEAAGWKVPSNPFTGTLEGDALNILVIAPHRDGFVSRGRYKGTITASGSFTAGQATAVAVTDGYLKDEAAPTRPAGTWTGHGEATCSKWPALPDAIVPLALISNGCGGGQAGEYGIQQRLGNRSTFLETANPLGERHTVTFKEACDLHDAGYSGAKVMDPINGGTIDYFDYTQAQVDTKFLDDMRALCKAQIPASAPVARKDCEGTGGYTSFGAETRYNFVRSHGHHFYRQRPDLNGSWSGGGVGTVTITQNKRYVRGTWQQGNVSGEFRGTLISHDQDSTVEGFAHTSDQPGYPSIHLVVNPDTPNSIQATGALSGTLTRG